jgi:hypothetical protein
MLRGIFTVCTASKEVIIKRQEVILRNQPIIHYKHEIVEPLEEFDEIEAMLVDPYGSLTAEALAYVQMGEAGSSNAPHGNNNDIRMMMMSQMMGRKNRSFLQLQCISYYLSFAFIRV